ncbi:MAG: 2-C-methyl-D-erythritol 4-phosphate cytidylyltransferase [Gammaproteobacteria bacterium]|jgi:2-C-methyl-D-erythritol 4-phosphate cytidylyltransferase|nr:2-C-methyl-D-erythritol 4-phosphate cytidylyltransferase [Gammaproteobacteria bacterium]MDX2458778.1 2-C-methyl-D-erythritol 4-phosphate cytidylyltransferase [Gammaproteobacteria bacterium]
MNTAKFWAVIPAAGIGSRMGGEIPKQYLPLLGRAVIAHTLECLCNHPRISGVVVAIAADDRWWSQISLEFATTPMVVDGGTERRDSVLNGLARLSSHASGDDWVLVHDAVRPCLRAGDIDRLMDVLSADEVGGLLAIPVRDTIKRCSADHRVRETVSRESLWQAQTPQMFRLGELRDAIQLSVDEDRHVTDEAQAMELSGARPRLVEGHEDNIKITRPEDLTLAETFLSHRKENL